MRMMKRTTPVLSALMVCAALFVLIRLQKEWINASREFAIRTVQISGNDLLTREEVLTLCDVSEGKNIWHFDLKRIESSLLENPFIETACALRRLPDVLEIRLKEKDPIALLNFEGKFYCIDLEGMILPSKPGKLYNLPVISGNFEGGVRIGSPANGAMLRKGLEFLKLVIHDRPEVYEQISEVVVGKPWGLLLFTSKNGIAVRIGEGREIEKIRCLEAAMKKIEQDPDRSRIRYIDLRFRGQVVIGMRA